MPKKIFDYCPGCDEKSFPDRVDVYSHRLSKLNLRCCICPKIPLGGDGYFFFVAVALFISFLFFFLFFFVLTVQQILTIDQIYMCINVYFFSSFRRDRSFVIWIYNDDGLSGIITVCGRCATWSSVSLWMHTGSKWKSRGRNARIGRRSKSAERPAWFIRDHSIREKGRNVVYTP